MAHMHQLMQELRNVAATSAQVDRSDVDDLVFMHALSNVLITSYETFNIEQPEFLKEARDTLTSEIKNRRRDYLQSQLRQAKMRRESLKTSEQKRRDTEDEIGRLEKTLGIRD